MKEFILIFRNSHNPDFIPSPEQMQEMVTIWMNWMGGLAAQNKLVDRGNRLNMGNSKVLKPNNVVTDGPYTEVKEFINGYTIVRADSVEDALALCHDCPILASGGSVEIRTIVQMDNPS